MNSQNKTNKPTFKRIDLPAVTARWAMAKKAKHARLYAREWNGLIVTVMVSRDPSGPNGQYEDHASISGRDANDIARCPTDDEVTDALDAIGWTRGTYTRSMGNSTTVHVYKVKR